jgi:hypothetical protein
MCTHLISINLIILILEIAYARYPANIRKKAGKKKVDYISSI